MSDADSSNAGAELLQDWCEQLTVDLYNRDFLHEHKASHLLILPGVLYEFAQKVIRGSREGRFDDIP